MQLSAYLNKFVDFHNNLSDKKFIWFPFYSLKPRADEVLTHGRIVVMTLCFSAYALLVYVLKGILWGKLELESVVSVSWKAFVVFFFWFEIVTSSLWNIRARKLQNKI